LRPSSENINDDFVSTKKQPKKRKSQTDVEIHDKVSMQDSQLYGDSRRIVSRNQSENTGIKNQKLIRRSIDIENVGVPQDTRKLTVKELPSSVKIRKESARKLTVKELPSNVKTKKESDEDQADSDQHEADDDSMEETEEPAKKSKKRRSSSPCFIVTLDGSSNKNEELPPKKKSHSTSEKTDKVRKTDENKPESESSAHDAKSTNEVCEKAAKSEKSKSLTDESTLSERELENMREKLLAMQEKAKKLKEIQSKRQELLQQKLNNGQVVQSNEKLIHVANVHFSATESQLSEHFSICGKVTKATILKDFSGHPKGYVL